MRSKSRRVPARPKLSAPTRRMTCVKPLPDHSPSVLGIDRTKSSRSGSKRRRSSAAHVGTESDKLDKACASNSGRRTCTSLWKAVMRRSSAPSSNANAQAVLDNSWRSKSAALAEVASLILARRGPWRKRSVAKDHAVLAKSWVMYSPMSLMDSVAKALNNSSSRWPTLAHAQNMFESSCGMSSERFPSVCSATASRRGLLRKPNAA
mmetsp:Transcript_65103/g.182035  ORF Transcript_65103/g.182035 Transcript_65103/m.182035 type:complete len:207 (-) Transcript_65103:66-686(-)